MFGGLKHGFRSLASLKIVVNVVGALKTEMNSCGIRASRGFLATARLSCFTIAAMPASLSVVTVVQSKPMFTVFSVHYVGMHNALLGST